MELLQNLIKFGKAEGFAYQSPPPLYLSTAICCAEINITGKKHNVNRIHNAFNLRA